MPIAIGAFLNAAGILLGGLFGLTWRNPISPRVQLFFRNALGLATILCGLFLIYQNASGTFLVCVKQIFLALLAVILGNLVGKFLRLQKISNYLGRIAGHSITAAQKHSEQNAITGLNACTILFCAAPLGILGAIVDGLSNYFYLLAIKAMMDGLATASFVKIFRWPAALSAIPVFAFLNSISLACQIYARPFLNSHDLTTSVNITAGFVVLAISVVIFEVRKVQLANYLPALVIAPLLAYFI
ncbi:MAG TPA: DUF554 family protein [Verrucomicrobiae bacterium]|nr:DUF554 family protein [Verrucomicrobiae bacterium]